MKKIGIITILKVDNYGAELQAYALQKKLRNMGYDAEILDYLYYKHRDHKNTPKSRPLWKLDSKVIIKNKLLRIFDKVKFFLNRKDLTIKHEKYDRFHTEYTKFSSKQFCSVEELFENEMDYDAYIVGSDQVWNPVTTVSSIEPYFLTFAPKNKLKISYASSFGVSSIPEYMKPKMAEMLQNLDRISVREQQGVELVQNLTNRKAEQVLDPTLLMGYDEWKDVSEPPATSDPYILIYGLAKAPYVEELANHIATIKGYKILRISQSSLIKKSTDTIEDIFDAGPSEYLGLFANASFVITNSFHGTAFSINFGKPFFSIQREGKANNSRQISLLNLCGLSDRLLLEGAAFPDVESLAIDYVPPQKILEEERRKSLSFLTDALENYYG